MRPIRWKGRFRTGDAKADKRNRAFVDYLNGLINTVGKREHCREMETVFDQLSSDVDKTLQERPANRDLKQEFGSQLLASLPLSPYGSNACRKCGLCIGEQEKIADHLEASAGCLFEPRSS